MAARAESGSGGQGNGGMLRIVGLAALVLVALGIAAVRLGWIGGGSSDELAKSESAVATSPAPDANAVGTDDVSIDQVAEEPAGTGSTPAPSHAPGSVRTATRLANNSSSVSAMTPDGARRAPLAQIDEHVTYQYNAIGRRDPFQSLLTGEFVGKDEGGDAPPDPGGMKIVGIVWGASDQFAMVEDVRGNSYVLRKGDKLQNGYVESLRRDAVVVNVTADGQSQQVVIPFVRKGEGNAR
jgi:hypothetical protein